jgi:hypothetical protein
MTTLIINDETKEGKAFLEYALKLPFVKTPSKKVNQIKQSLSELKADKHKDLDKLKKTPNKTTLKAMHEAEKGIITKARNVNDLIDKLNS